MKSVILAIALVLSSTAAMAQNRVVFGGMKDDLRLEFLSWCEGNKVMAENEEGKNYVRTNCEDQGQVCKVYDAYKFGTVLYSAACEAKK